MSFNRFFSLFCQVLGALWWVPIMVFTEKKYTYICEQHIDRASNKVVFFCVQTGLQTFIEFFWSQKLPMLSKKITIKK